MVSNQVIANPILKKGEDFKEEELKQPDAESILSDIISISKQNKSLGRMLRDEELLEEDEVVVKRQKLDLLSGKSTAAKSVFLSE